MLDELSFTLSDLKENVSEFDINKSNALRNSELKVKPLVNTNSRTSLSLENRDNKVLAQPRKIPISPLVTSKLNQTMRMIAQSPYASDITNQQLQFNNSKGPFNVKQFQESPVKEEFPPLSEPLIEESSRLINQKFQEISELKQSMIETQANLQIEKLKKEIEILQTSNRQLTTKYEQDLIDFKESYLKTKDLENKSYYENLFQQQYEEKIKQLKLEHTQEKQQIQSIYQQQIQDYKQKIDNQRKEHLQSMTEMEQVLQNKYQTLETNSQQKIQTMEQEIQKQIQFKELTNQSYHELKIEKLEKNYSKKLLVYEKKIQEVVQHYQQKELVLEGSVNELRRETVALQEIIKRNQQLYHEELILKDKRILKIQFQHDNIIKVEQECQKWKEIAHSLSLKCIKACSTVEAIIAETTSEEKGKQGVFGTLWEEYFHQKQSYYNKNHDLLKQYYEDYLKKSQTHVLCKRSLLSKCLKYSQMVHDRYKADRLTKDDDSMIDGDSLDGKS